MKVEIYSKEKQINFSKLGFSGIVAGIQGKSSFVVDCGNHFEIQKACNVGSQFSDARAVKFEKHDFPTVESVAKYIEVYMK